MRLSINTPARLAALLACSLFAQAHAAVFTNGGFESGLTGWTTVDQIGSDGSFLLQTGTASPINAFPVPAPPEGTSAAMTDAQGPGSHILYQDFLVPTVTSSALLSFSLYVNNGALAFVTPSTLDFSTPALNQQARVDITTAGSDPFSLAAGVILQNLYRTIVGDPLVSGYNTIQVDVTSLLQSHQGETLRLRFAEVDNVSTFNLGVDNVTLAVDAASAVPEPSSWLLVGSAVLIAGIRRLRN